MNEENKNLFQIQRDNQKKMADLQNNQALESIKQEEKRIDADTQQQQKQIRAEKEQSVQIIKADAVKTQAQLRAQKEAENILAEAKAYA